MKGYDPLARAKELEKVVVKGTSRKYYRLARGGKWYGGIATADCSIKEIIFKAHFCNPLFDHAKPFSCSIGQINDPIRNKGSTVIYSHY